MKTRKIPLPSVARRLLAFGERLRLARLRRLLSAETVASRARITRGTLNRVEAGDAGVSIRNYASVLAVLQMDEDIDLLAKDDALGRRLQDEGTPQRRRAPKKTSLQKLINPAS